MVYYFEYSVFLEIRVDFKWVVFNQCEVIYTFHGK